MVAEAVADSKIGKEDHRNGSVDKGTSYLHLISQIWYKKKKKKERKQDVCRDGSVLKAFT